MFSLRQMLSLSLVVAAALLSVASSGSDSSSDSDYVFDGSCESVAPHAIAAGVLETPVADIPYDGERAHALLRHKRDVDRDEDGCVAAATLVFTVAGECGLSLAFEVAPAETELVLVSASLDADSSCPGWPDELEATYRYAGEGDARLSVAERMPADTAEACVELELAPRGTITLGAPDREDLEVTLDSLTTSGPAISEGEPELSCPGS